MIERDYIMRMIRMLTASLAKIFFHKDLGQHGEALNEINHASEHLIGMKWKFLRSFSDVELISLLGSSGQKDKMIAASELLRAESEILFEQGQSEEACAIGVKAFSLFAELIIEEKDYLTMMHADKFASLLQRLEHYQMPLSLELKRFRFYEIVGRFADAEAVVLDLIERDPPFIDDAIAFYQRMVEKPDDELEKGGLHKEEASRTMTKLESLRQQS